MREKLLIRVVRSGGITGIPRRGVLELGVHESAKDGEVIWLGIAHEALVELRALRESAASALMRDTFTWSLSINGEQHVVPDTLLSGASRTLAEHVIGAAHRD